MSERVDVVLGFDPGGKGKFGWSICTVGGGQLCIRKTGVASHALDVIRMVSSRLPSNARVLAAGIDAPMFWSDTGNRRIDRVIREELKRRGLPARSVLEVNALWGAVLVQGILLASYLYQEFNAVPITEAHPKVLLHLLEESESARLTELAAGRSEHERDAVVAAFAAWSMHRRAPGWRNLYWDEPNPILPLKTPVSYWMPIPAGECVRGADDGR